MHDVLAMAITDSLEDLFNNFDGIVFAETHLWDNSIEQFSSLAVVSYDIDSFIGFDDIKYLDNVGMILLNLTTRKHNSLPIFSGW